MKTNFTFFILTALLSCVHLSAQTFEFPAMCNNPETGLGGTPDDPKLFGAIELEGVSVPDGTVVGVFNEADGLIGLATSFTQSDGAGGTFSAVLVQLQTDQQITAMNPGGCPVFTAGEMVTVRLENEPNGNLATFNSTFIGTPATQGILTGPDGDVTMTDTFNFEARFLPVTFSSLSATERGGKVTLDWSTASESGNEYFEVEHATSLGEFTAVGTVDGAGDSQELRNYEFLHGMPAVGTNYYRIKQVDFEGTFSYSGIIPVQVAAVQQTAVSLFPNPAATGFFNVNVGSDWSVETVSVAVVNAIGRRVMEWNQDVTATRQVSTDDLAAGMYLVRIEGGKRTSTKRLIVK